MNNLVVKETIGGHLVRNLEIVDDLTIIGEVANKYDPDEWEKTKWKRDNTESSYYSTNLGEWWDIELNNY